MTITAKNNFVKFKPSLKYFAIRTRPSNALHSTRPKKPRDKIAKRNVWP